MLQSTSTNGKVEQEVAPESDARKLWRVGIRPHVKGIAAALDKYFDIKDETRCPQCGHVHSAKDGTRQWQG